MCGLFAVFQKNTPIVPNAVEASIRMLNHRGPDYSAVSYFTANVESRQPFTLQCALAHTRLAILDLDPRANQPFGCPKQGTLVYNGEIYNFRELRSGRANSAEFSTDCDTELLYKDLLCDEEVTFSDYNGMWAFAFWNNLRQRVSFGRDRYGQKPLYYYLDDERFIISSEIRPILHYLRRPVRFNESLIASFIRHGTAFPLTHDQTIVESIAQLPPSHFGTFNPATWTLSLKQYFDPALLVDEAPRESLANAFRRAVIARLVSDRPVGLLLSGGIDSTLILSVLASENRLDQVRCFIGDTGTSEDAAYARKCAEQLGINFEDIQLDYTQSAFDRFLQICAHMEKPFQMLGNSMALPQMYHAVSQTDVRVVLDGTGGDEVFGGYWDRYLPSFAKHADISGHEKWLKRTAYGNHLPAELSVLDARLSGENQRFNQSSARYFRERVANAVTMDPLAQQRLSPTETLLTDAFQGRLSEWIWQNDRNAMTFGLENRSPFLDVGLVPFFGTDYRKKFRGQWNKLELRELFEAFTTLPTQWRQQKQGFRWQAKEFVNGNEKRLLELIGSSHILSHLVHQERFLDDYRSAKPPSYALTTRLACLAALELTLSATV